MKRHSARSIELAAGGRGLRWPVSPSTLKRIHRNPLPLPSLETRYRGNNRDRRDPTRSSKFQRGTNLAAKSQPSYEIPWNFGGFHKPLPPRANAVAQRRHDSIKNGNLLILESSQRKPYGDPYRREEISLHYCRVKWIIASVFITSVQFSRFSSIIQLPRRNRKVKS